VATCRKLGLKLILDFVPNHCSSEHPWFKDALSSATSARRDWFIWRDPAPDGGVPNNWLSAFGGPAWTLDKASGQYWMHSFLPEQPDLNWYNPAVRKAMFDSMRLWFSRGVDGFRVDVILRLVKDKLFRDEPPNPSWYKGMPEYDSLLHIHTRNAEGVLEFVRMLREVTDEFPDRVLIGETYLPIPELMKYYASGKGCHLPFNFGLITTKPIPSAIASYVNEYLEALPPGACPNWVLGNHDVPRIAAPGRFGEAAANATMLLFTLPGAITSYYGDELPMADAVIPAHRIRDPKVLREGGGLVSRDSARTPMQWDASPFSGFSIVEPWLPINPDYPACNVSAARSDPASILNLTKQLIALRKLHPEIVTARPELVSDGDLLMYSIPLPGLSLEIRLNFGAVPLPAHLPEGSWTVLLSTHACDGEPPPNIPPRQGFIFGRKP